MERIAIVVRIARRAFSRRAQAARIRVSTGAFASPGLRDHHDPSQPGSRPCVLHHLLRLYDYGFAADGYATARAYAWRCVRHRGGHIRRTRPHLQRALGAATNSTFSPTRSLSRIAARSSLDFNRIARLTLSMRICPASPAGLPRVSALPLDALSNRRMMGNPTMMIAHFTKKATERLSPRRICVPWLLLRNSGMPSWPLRIRHARRAASPAPQPGCAPAPRAGRPRFVRFPVCLRADLLAQRSLVTPRLALD